jgi:hypothetical protein
MTTITLYAGKEIIFKHVVPGKVSTSRSHSELSHS